MVLDDKKIIHNSWIILQQPTHASIGQTAFYRTILAVIDKGWRVEEPVEVIPTAREDFWIYCFVLRHTFTGQTFRLYTPATPEMEQFIARNHYQVIEGSYIEFL